MGTNAAFTFWGERADCDEAAAATIATFREVNDRFSVWQPDTELSRLNREAFEADFVCSDEMWAMLQQGRRAYDVSNGAFDMSAGPLMKLWGFHRKRQTTPSETEIAEIQARVGLDKVVFDDDAQTVRFTVKGMELDSGGIAKGHALDLAAAKLADMGVKQGLLDLGGNILALSEPPPGRAFYTVGVRNPRQRSEHVGTINILGQAVATSGDYERFVMLEGKKYSHIMDPRTGMPVAGMAAVTVVTEQGIASDYLSTAVFVNRGENMAALHEDFPRLNVLLIQAGDDGVLSAERHGDIWNAIKEIK